MKVYKAEVTHYNHSRERIIVTDGDTAFTLSTDSYEGLIIATSGYFEYEKETGLIWVGAIPYGNVQEVL